MRNCLAIFGASALILLGIIAIFSIADTANNPPAATTQESPETNQEETEDPLLSQCLDNIGKGYAEADYSDASVEEIKVAFELRSQLVDECYRRYDR